MQIQKSTFDFLTELRENNDRSWFNERKPVYLQCLDNSKEVFAEVYNNLIKHDEIEKQKIYRIYRDIRFSKDKTPYNPRFATDFTRKGSFNKCDYFLRVKPNESMIVGGLWMPEKLDLYRLRKEIEFSDKEFRELLSSHNFKKYFGGHFEGEELKTAPMGFDKHHPAIDLIRKKMFLAIRKFSNEEVLSETFLKEVDKTFKAMRPFFDLVSDILSTDDNGESIIS
ncbi:MAG: DUF2461 domain-containing protein [Bacteroidales bacterium]